MNKVQKIREEVERRKSQLLRGACSSQVAMETRCKEEAYNEVLAILDTMQEEPKSKFEQCIQEGDNIIYNEDLGCRVNLSLLDRVAKKEEPKKCMYIKDNYTYEDRKVLCDGCEEECEYAQKESDWLQELQDKPDSLSKEDFDKVWAKYHQKEEPVSEELEEAARRYAALQAGMKDAMTSEYYEEYPYSPNDIEAFKAGAQWQLNQIRKKNE